MDINSDLCFPLSYRNSLRSLASLSAVTQSVFLEPRGTTLTAPAYLRFFLDITLHSEHLQCPSRCADTGSRVSFWHPVTQHFFLHSFKNSYASVSTRPTDSLQCFFLFSQEPSLTMVCICDLVQPPWYPPWHYSNPRARLSISTANTASTGQSVRETYVSMPTTAPLWDLLQKGCTLRVVHRLIITLLEQYLLKKYYKSMQQN